MVQSPGFGANVVLNVEVDWAIEGLSSGDIRDVAECYQLPLAMWDEETTVVLLVNQRACDLLGLPAEKVVGHPVEQFLDTSDGAAVTVEALRTGVVDDLRSHRRFRVRDGPVIELPIWTRTVIVDGKRCAVSVAVEDDELPVVEHDSTWPWRELAQTAVGAVDGFGRISAVSAEISALVGGRPSDWVGEPLADIVWPAEAHLVRRMTHMSDAALAQREVHLRSDDGLARLAWLVVATDRSRRQVGRTFAIVGSAGPSAPGDHDRVRELELRLRRISAEVRAAGILDILLDHHPGQRHFPQLAELSTRQWDILTRLRRGDGVAAIARSLFLSPSTVRNHLSSIYRKFGVHSQAELLALLNQPLSSPSDRAERE